VVEDAVAVDVAGLGMGGRHGKALVGASRRDRGEGEDERDGEPATHAPRPHHGCGTQFRQCAGALPTGS
jgi:hypothetical protein